MPPQLLIAGHIVKDITAEGWTAGGGALYAAAQAARLGVGTAVVTACERDIDPSALVPGVDWRVVHVDEGIRFENSYRDGVRTQRVRPCERVIRLKDIPEAWRGARMVLLEPVFHNVDPSLP